MLAQKILLETVLLVRHQNDTLSAAETGGPLRWFTKKLYRDVVKEKTAQRRGSMKTGSI
jgi:hypothetical protein